MNKFIDWIDEHTWWRHKIKHGYYNIKCFIGNLIHYFPMLISDRNWDDTYIFKVLLYKLKRQEQMIRKWNHLTTSIKSADEILFCINLIETRILNNYGYYELSGYNKLEDKWGELKLFPIDDNTGLLRMRREYEQSKEDHIQVRKDTNKACDHMDYLITQDINYLFDYMKKHIRNWWD